MRPESDPVERAAIFCLDCAANEVRRDFVIGIKDVDENLLRALDFIVSSTDANNLSELAEQFRRGQAGGELCIREQFLAAGVNRRTCAEFV